MQEMQSDRLSAHDYAQKKNIPSRVKDLRYKAQPISHKVRTNRSANEQSSFQSNYDDVNSISRHKTTAEVLLDSMKHKVPLRAADSQTLMCDIHYIFQDTNNWFAWHDKSVTRHQSDHGCFQHYMLNERLYLDRVPAIKTLPALYRTPCEKTTSNGKQTTQNNENECIITLPKYLLDYNFSPVEQLNLHGQMKSEKNSRKCSLVKNSAIDNKYTLSMPPDSYALSHQILEV